MEYITATNRFLFYNLRKTVDSPDVSFRYLRLKSNLEKKHKQLSCLKI